MSWRRVGARPHSGDEFAQALGVGFEYSTDRLGDVCPGHGGVVGQQESGDGATQGVGALGARASPERSMSLWWSPPQSIRGVLPCSGSCRG